MRCSDRVTRKAESTEFVLKTYAPSLLRQQIDRLKLWDTQPRVQLDTLCDYFTRYLPRVRDHGVIRAAIQHMTDTLLPEQDGFAYADAHDDGRYRGLTIIEPPAVVRRDISLVTDEILTPLFTANGVPVTITVDIESTSLAMLSPPVILISTHAGRITRS